MRGRFLIGPHALTRYRERVPGKRNATMDDLLDDATRWYRVRDKGERVGLWRHTPEPRYRVVVDEEDQDVLKVITILGIFDRC